MDCRTAHLLLEFARPGRTELEADEAEALERHLADCPDCAQWAQAERAWDDHVGSALRAVPAPAGLRERLLARLEADSAAFRRRRRWRGVGSLAAAAVLLLAVLLSLDWKRHHRPDVDLERACYEFFGQTANPAPQQLEDWLHEQRFLAVAPRDFNYRLLRYSAIVDFQGKRVPLLLFTQGKEQARVFILADEQFNFASLRATPGSGCKLEVRYPPSDRRFAFLVVHTGESLEPFLNPQPIFE